MPLGPKISLLHSMWLTCRLRQSLARSGPPCQAGHRRSRDFNVRMRVSAPLLSAREIEGPEGSRNSAIVGGVWPAERWTGSGVLSCWQIDWIVLQSRMIKLAYFADYEITTTHLVRRALTLLPLTHVFPLGEHAKKAGRGLRRDSVSAAEASSSVSRFSAWKTSRE